MTAHGPKPSNVLRLSAWLCVTLHSVCVSAQLHDWHLVDGLLSDHLATCHITVSNHQTVWHLKSRWAKRATPTYNNLHASWTVICLRQFLLYVWVFCIAVSFGWWCAWPSGESAYDLITNMLSRLHREYIFTVNNHQTISKWVFSHCVWRLIPPLYIAVAMLLDSPSSYCEILRWICNLLRCMVLVARLVF